MKSSLSNSNVLALTSTSSSNSNSLLDVLWSLLGKKVCLLFGKECIKVSIWMFIVMLGRTICHIIGLESFVPLGFIFAFPHTFLLIRKRLQWLGEYIPVLPIRLAESILGRIGPSKLLVIIPAHFLGAILGVVMFRLVNPFTSLDVYKPIEYGESIGLGILAEVVVVCFYCCMVLALPELLIVNKLSASFLSIPIIPLMLVQVAGGQGSTFNPAAIYALGYIYHGKLPPLQAIYHLVAIVVGSIAAGLVCLKFFPDDERKMKM